MATFLDLPLEIRSQIYRLLIDWEETFSFGSGALKPKLHKVHPSILCVNKTISHEAGMTFYRDNPGQIWIEVDYDKRDTIDIKLDAALLDLTDQDAVPQSWQCAVTMHVSYGLSESEFYEGRLILCERQLRYPTLSAAPEGKGILGGWRQWFSGGRWYVRHFYAPAMRKAKSGTQAPIKGLRTRRGRSWKVGDIILGEVFVSYLERLLPQPWPLPNQQSDQKITI